MEAFLSSFSTTIVITLPTALAADTIRGGAVAVVSAGATLLTDTSLDQALTGTVLPAGYIGSVSDGIVTPTLKGVTTEVSHFSGGFARVESPATFEHFDAAIDVELLAIPVEPSSISDLASFEFVVDGTNFIRIVIQKGIGDDPNTPVAFGETSTSPGEGLVSGNGTFFADVTGKLTFRIVRHGSRVFGFIGRRNKTTGEYTELTQVVDYKIFGTALGLIRFQVQNLTSASPTVARWSNLTYRSHVTIDSELIEDKIDFGIRRIVGKVPATTLARAGFRDIALFGLFGESIGPASFEYTLPSPKTVGRGDVPRLLKTFTDTQLRDVNTSVDLKDIGEGESF